MIDIAEIFYSIQGESSYAGLPCIFIRLSGCNLRCKYCDTTFSYESGVQLSIENILQKIKAYPTKLVEITGGEPLCQSESFSLMKALIEKNYRVLLETNGSITIENVPKEVHIIMDIKTPSSGYEASFTYQNLKFIKRTDEIKFVLGSREDYDWVKNQIDRYDLTKYNLLISTIFSQIEPKEVVGWILEDALNVRFQLQMHKYIWDPEKQGV